MAEDDIFQPTPWRWGKAGQRLTPQEIEQRRRDIAARRNREREARERSRDVGYKLWQTGHLVPDRITLALDAKDLEGPDVDVACLAREPEVDLWEAGTLYPSWEQTEALAKLCGVTVPFLCVQTPPPHVCDTSMRFHVPAHELARLRPPVLRFTDAAVTARMSAAALQLAGQLPLFDL